MCLPRFRARVLSFLLLSAATLHVAGALAQSQPAEKPEATTTIRTTARIVYVDVVVRDSGGHVVHGLKEGDFRLDEDKKPQRISLFEEHSGSGGTPAGSTPGTRELTNIPSGMQNRSLNIVLFDLANTDISDQPYARQRMISFLRAMPPGKQVALFVLGNRLQMVQGFTGDSATLVKSAESIDIKQLNRTRSSAQELQDLDTSAYVDSQATIARVGDQLKSQLFREDVQNMKGRLDFTADAFTQLAHAVNGFAGRKNLFWLAGQFPSSAYYRLQALSTQTTSISGVTGSGSRQVAREVSGEADALARSPLSERADRAIADSQIAVYPISVFGVETDSIDASQSGIGTAGDGHATDTMALQFNERQQTRSVMNEIADATGGEAFFGNNDIAGLLRRGFEDSENYYTLAYSPTDHDWNGKYRRVALSVSGGHYTLSYRRGYLALPEQPGGDTSAQFQRAMNISAPESTMLALRAAPGAAAGVLQLDATLDLNGIGFTVDAAGKRQARLLVGLMAYPFPAQAGVPTQTSGKLNLNLNQEQYAALLSSGVFVHQQLPLKPGKYVLRVGVLDTGSGRVGTLTIPVAMP